MTYTVNVYLDHLAEVVLRFILCKIYSLCAHLSILYFRNKVTMCSSNLTRDNSLELFCKGDLSLLPHLPF